MSPLSEPGATDAVPGPSRLRRFASRLALWGGITSVALGAIGATFSRSAFDPVAFGDRVASSLSDPRVAAWSADRITQAVLEESPDLTAVRPLILVAAQGLATSEPMRGVVRTAARSAHRAFFTEGTQQLVLSVPDVGVLLRSAFGSTSPELAESIPEQLEALATSLSIGDRARVVVDLFDLRSALSLANTLLLSLGPLLAALGLGLALDRRRAFLTTGVLLLGAGLSVGAVLPLGSLAIEQLTGEPRKADALVGLWTTCLAGLRVWALLLGGLGLLFASASTSLLEEFAPADLARRAAAVLTAPPATRGRRALWGASLVGLGLVTALAPALVVGAVAVIAGTAIAVVGARELFRLMLERVEETPLLLGGSDARRSLLRATAVVTLTLGLAAAWLGWRAPIATPSLRSVGACNGHAALCRRPVEDVVFAGSHNAMSNTEIADWMFPHHQRSILHQLEGGVRALLIDVHYGLAGASRIKTDVAGQRPTQEVLEHALGEEGLAAAMRIRERLVGADEGQRDLYLCHGFCELGATLLVPTLREIRGFLLQHPAEVVLVVIEDYATPEDLAGAFEESGLLEHVYRGPAGPPWPRLLDLVASGQNLLVFLESGRPGVRWLRPAFENVQETPYTFHSAAEFSCRENRGGRTGSLFQINHWIETTPAPRPSNADEVNATGVLLERARQCQAERRMLPNVIAVDFSGRGDLLAVVDDLNGFASGSAAARP